ncbi:dihydropteroate synthase [Pelagicoccus sp. SDUM812003]|uniref:dihydropteroate synthase n=1 Tax=Pelagicoccus sp. SDUM812003 TaxID=3041267 RepID=UPI00280F1F61|nr:dihydropteroate synthase [Pelagicoccus sp. SDUM812003]MDQ8201600.1 dihydropteroate synthase [Pelagicoccus sp. SDUM812003]
MAADGDRSREWRLGETSLMLGDRSLMMGILNVTPDSFSDGGRYDAVEPATRQALRLLEQGAAMVDVGGESTRPGFEPVSEKEEIRRVVPVIQAVLQRDPSAILSIDTSKAPVAAAAIEAGARIVNDVWGFQSDVEIASVAAQCGTGVALMRNGRGGGEGGSILEKVKRSWATSVEIALKAGVREEAIVLDPGIGFGTTRQEDLEIMRGLAELGAFGFPLLLGTSRKRITAMPLGLPVESRLPATVATTVAGIAAGVDVFRVHDVAENLRASLLADLIYRGGQLDG